MYTTIAIIFKIDVFLPHLFTHTPTNNIDESIPTIQKELPTDNMNGCKARSKRCNASTMKLRE